MAGKTKEQRLQEVHTRAVERFDLAYSAQRDMRQQCVRDRRFVFVPGAQFEGDLGDQFANRPRFEINKVHQAVIRIFSEYRNNRVTVDFRPDDEGTNEDTADFLDGLYRADEQDSGAQEAYDTAFEEGVAGGMGAWRLVNCYEDEEDEDSDRRRIRIEPIPDADNSVFFDADAKRYDKSDAGHAFVICGMQDAAYEDLAGETPGAARRDWQDRRKKLDGKGQGVTSFDRVERMGAFDWFAPDVTYIAEYYEKETVSVPVNFYVSATGDEEEKLRPKDFEKAEDFEAAEQRLKDQGFTLARVKKIKTCKVHKYIIDGARVVEDCGYIAGKHIPIVPYYAKRLYVDNIERIMGHIRLAVDLQRLYNMLCSLLAEIAVQSPVEKPILTPEETLGHEEMWALDGIKRYPYLHVNKITDSQGAETVRQIQYTKAPAIPPGLAALLQLIGLDLKEVLNSEGDQQQVVSNISAKAVELIQNRLDMQSFIYTDNLKKSMKRSGEVWLSMARDLYDEDDRPMRVVNVDGTDEIKKLRQPTKADDESTGYVNDPAAGKFKVTADVGPSFTTKRDGTVRAITGMMQFVEDPADKSVLAGVAIQNLEGEGLQDVKAHFRRKSILAGVTKPTEDEAKEIEEAKARAAQKPDPQAEFLMAEAKKSEAMAEKARAETALTLQKIEESSAKVAQMLEGIDAARIAQILQLVEGLTPQAQGGAPGAVQAGAQPVPVA